MPLSTIFQFYEIDTTEILRFPYERKTNISPSEMTKIKQVKEQNKKLGRVSPQIYTVKPALRGHHWDKEKVVF
jgi:hypothetical protein